LSIVYENVTLTRPRKCHFQILPEALTKALRHSYTIAEATRSEGFYS